MLVEWRRHLTMTSKIKMATENSKINKTKAKLKRQPSDKEPVSVAYSEPKVQVCSETSMVANASMAQKVAPADWFTSEIQAMMHGFGDCRNPLIESARLIEEIVHQQMNTLLIQTCDVAMTRGARFIGPEDVIFLMRKDKVKLARMLKYMAVKDMKPSLAKGVDEEETAEHQDGKPVAIKSKRLKLAQDFLSLIDQTGELLSLFTEDVFDEPKYERNARADQQTKCMDQAQYLEYCEAKCASFVRKYRSTKFRDWLLKDNVTEIKPTNLALELFNYLAYETVAQIVDLALLVKQDSQNDSDQLARLAPPVTCNPGYPSIHLSSHLAKPPVRPDSPSQATTSPPSSPSSQTSGAHQTPGGPQTSKPKPKKRRKSECKVALESQCILPSDIREAIQRYWRETGPFLLFAKSYHSSMSTRFLAC